MEFIYPMRLGFKPIRIENLIKKSDWSGVMIDNLEVLMANFKNDDRITSIEALMTSVRWIPYLIENRDRYVQLKSIFLSPSSNSYEDDSRDPAKFLEAFPGLQRIYVKQGMGMIGNPLRHVCLEYLGIPVASLHDKRLCEMVLPNLQVLSIREFSTDPELIENFLEDLLLIVTGQLFPNLERLYIGHCPFINQLTKKLFIENERPIQIRKFDLMDSYEVDPNSDAEYLWQRRVNPDFEFLTKIENELEVTTNSSVPDHLAKRFKGRLRTNVGLVPY